LSSWKVAVNLAEFLVQNMIY